LRAHRSGLANAEVLGSSPRRPTTVLSSVRPDNTARRRNSAPEGRTPVPSLITPLMPDNTAEARRAKAKGKQRRIRVPPDSASSAREGSAAVAGPPGNSPLAIPPYTKSIGDSGAPQRLRRSAPRRLEAASATTFGPPEDLGENAHLAPPPEIALESGRSCSTARRWRARAVLHRLRPCVGEL
jgi:hypothetical protein